MPVNIKVSQIKYKDANGDYVGINGVSERATAEEIAAIEAKGAETIASIPSDYTALSNEVDSIWGTMNFVSDITLIEFNDGYYITTNGTFADITTPVRNTAYTYAVIPCSAGDVFTITGVGAQAARLWTFINNNSEQNIVLRESANVSKENFILTAPENSTYLILNMKIAEDHFACVGKTINAYEKQSKLMHIKTSNLAEIGNGIYSESPYHVSSSFDEIMVSGSNSDRQIIVVNDKHTLAPGTYSAAIFPRNDDAQKNRSRFTISIVNSADSSLIYSISNSAGTFTVSSYVEVRYQIYVGINNNTTTFNGSIFGLMINKGETVSEFEPSYLSCDYVARENAKELTTFGSSIPALVFTNHEIDNDRHTEMRSLSTALSNYIPPIYTGVKLIDSDYKFRVYVFDKHNNLIGKSSYYTVSSNKIDYSFDFSLYNYRISIVAIDGSRAENLEEYGNAIVLYANYDQMNNYIEKVWTEQEKACRVKENESAIRKILLRANYDVRFANSARPIPLMNVYGNTQNVHPKTLYIPNGFAGFKYWMAYTPYPYARTHAENPCIAYSDDGYEFTNIDGNPIDEIETDDTGYYNSDTHLVLVNETLECWYRHVEPDNEYIYRRTTVDGVNWTSRELLYTSNAHSNVLCPIVIYEENKYMIWVINNSTKKVDYYESSNGKNWTFIRSITAGAFVHDGVSYYPWHGDVILDNDTYIMVMMCKNESGSDSWISVLQTSSDNISYSEPQVILGAGLWDQVQYRISITKVEDIYRLYYSGIGRNSLNNAVYGIGISESDTLGQFIGVDI